MSFPEPLLVIPSASTLSLNDLSIDYPRSTPLNHTMSFPILPKRLRSLRAKSTKRRKVSQKTLTSSVISQHRQDSPSSSNTDLAAHTIENQVPETIVIRHLDSHEPSRRREIMPRWLETQKQRFKGFRKDILAHRDSMFDQELEHELRRASREANDIILGPHGEAVPQLVINIFFARYPAGGSDWRNSVRWEKHLAEYLEWKGFFITKDFQNSQDCSLLQQHRTSVATKTPPARTPSPLTPSRSSDEKEPYFFSPPSWFGPSKRKQERGKSLAPDETDNVYSGLTKVESLGSRTQKPTLRRRGGITIQERTTRQPKSIRCASISKAIDSSLIVEPPASDLKPASSEGFDPYNLAHCTGRHYEDPAPIETLDFPLAAPVAPQPRPKRRITPVPPVEQLGSIETVQFKPPPIQSAGPRATTVQRWQSQPIDVLRKGARFTADDDTVVDSRSHKRFEMPCIYTYKPPPARSARHNPAFSMSEHLPPTSPDSRHNSNASQSLAEIIFSAAVPSPAEPTTPNRSADRHWAPYTLSDTTGSSLPECPVFVSREELLQRCTGRWAGHAERHGPGMRNWR